MVTKDVPNYALVLGNPAGIAGWMCECGNRLDFHNDVATCNDCEKQFSRHGEKDQCFEEEWDLPQAVANSSVS